MDLNTATYGAMIKRGVVLIASFEGIDHKKFFVVVGEGEDEFVGFFFINSNISKRVERVEKYRNMQMHIKRASYPNFLTHDSFIGAHNLETISKSELTKQIQTGEAQYCGELTPDDLELLLYNVRRSPIYPELYQKTFFKP
jgi:hypothetical protein